MMDGDLEKTETKRDRVRRLLVYPLRDNGFRFPNRTSDDDARARLDALCDALGYMTDRGLGALADCMRTKGEGSRRDFWPSLASFVGFAEAFEKQPLSELPALLRWFASAAGDAALAKGEAHLLAEYEFWRDKKHPPKTPRDWEKIQRRAVDLARIAELARDRVRRDCPRPDDLQWLSWFDAHVARVRGYVGAHEVDHA